MGCINTTDFKLDACSEELIQTYEIWLGYHKRPATDTITEIKDFTHGGRMHFKQFKEMLKSINFDTRALAHSTCPQAKFYSFLGDRKKIDPRKVSVLAVMLGTGTLSKKAEVLFDLFQTNKVLEISGVDAMVQEICLIALKFLPAYTALELEELKDPALIKLEKYQVKMDVAFRYVAIKLRDYLEFGRKNVSLRELKDSSVLKYLCSTHELRHLACELYEKLPKLSKIKREEPSPQTESFCTHDEEEKSVNNATFSGVSEPHRVQRKRLH